MVGRGDFLTTFELSRRWKLSERTLLRWRAACFGPAWVLIGGSIRYPVTDVLAWEAGHLTRP